MAGSSTSIAFATVQETPDSTIFSRAELERASGLKVRQRQLQFLCGRGLLRTLLQHHTGKPASSHHLVTSDTGKPACVGGPAISIAHSGDLVICAISDLGEIGVDIESPRQRKNLRDIASRYFAADETQWLAAQPQDRFYMLWVLKEAWLKAKGTGIAGGLDRLRCFVVPPDIDARVDGESSPSLSLYSLDNMLVGLATLSASHNDVSFYCWDPLTDALEPSDNPGLVAASQQDC